jgi:hypothetical protein
VFPFPSGLTEEYPVEGSIHPLVTAQRAPVIDELRKTPLLYSASPAGFHDRLALMARKSLCRQDRTYSEKWHFDGGEPPVKACLVISIPRSLC